MCLLYVFNYMSLINKPDLPFLTVFNNLLTEKECLSLIDYMETKNQHLVDRGTMAEYYRVEMDSPEIAKTLFDRIKDHIPRVYNEMSLDYLNDHFRFSKYHPGQEFKIHRDGFNIDSEGGQSIMTLNIFLNDQFKGGETDFFYDFDDKEPELRYSAKPKPGRGCLFEGPQILHCGNKVTEGFKYLLRTDVMTRSI